MSTVQSRCQAASGDTSAILPSMNSVNNDLEWYNAEIGCCEQFCDAGLLFLQDYIVGIYSPFLPLWHLILLKCLRHKHTKNVFSVYV